jgi:hypothetical protein
MTHTFLIVSQQPNYHLPSRAGPIQETSYIRSSISALIITGAIAIGMMIYIIGHKRHDHWRRKSHKNPHLKSYLLIPCCNCYFYKDNRYLRCAVHPSTVLTQQAIDCLDYQPRESDR